MHCTFIYTRFASIVLRNNIGIFKPNEEDFRDDTVAFFSYKFLYVDSSLILLSKTFFDGKI